MQASTDEPADVRNAAGGKVRAGVIGLGRAGTFFHCRALSESPDFELAGVHDARPEAAARVAAQYGCRHHATVDGLLNDPDIDLAVLAVPTCFHTEFALKAIQRGLPVLVEKPFAPTSGEAARIFDAGQRAGVPVIAYHNRRFDPDVNTLRRIIRAGTLGEIVKVSIHLHSFVRRRDWQTLRSMGGGALANWGSHAIDWCFHLFGPDIELEWAKLFHVLNAGDAEDGFLIGLASGKTTIDIEYLNCASQSLPKWQVVGSLGTAVSDNNRFHLKFCEPDRLIPIHADTSAASDGTYGLDEDLGWQEEVESWDYWDNCPLFLEALHRFLTGRGPVPVDPGEVVAELRLVEKIRSSARLVRFRTGKGAPALQSVS